MKFINVTKFVVTIWCIIGIGVLKISKKRMYLLLGIEIFKLNELFKEI